MGLGIGPVVAYSDYWEQAITTRQPLGRLAFHASLTQLGLF